MTIPPYQREYRHAGVGAAEIQAFIDEVLPEVQRRARRGGADVLDLRDIHPALGVLDLTEDDDAVVAATLAELEVSVTEPRQGLEPVSVGLLISLCHSPWAAVVAKAVVGKLVTVSLDVVLERWVEPVIRRRFGFDTLQPPIDGPTVDLTDQVTADLRDGAATEVDLRDVPVGTTAPTTATPEPGTIDGPGPEVRDAATRPDDRPVE